ncbi:MAG TPA: PQQ-binding-like beta-propeller repeat protein [Gaiellaceae bacterium]
MIVFPVFGLRRAARRGSLIGGLAVSIALAVAAFAGAARADGPAWPMSGHDSSNSHANTDESVIGTNDVGSLAPKWVFTTHGDVSADPAVVGGAVYFPDWGGYLNKVDAKTGNLIWQRQVSSYDGVAGSVSRTGPAVVKGVVYIGDQNGAHLMAINATTGALIWSSQMDGHPTAILTASPLVVNGVVYQGVASSEEAAAIFPSYPCCTFRGSLVAVDAMTGGILWKTYTVPDNGGLACTTQNPATGCGYSGGAVWGSTPALDANSNTLYIGTGNNYTVPDAEKTCEANGGTASQCLSPDDHVDAVMALNASTGAIKWSTGVQGFDDWNVACIPGFDPHNCPNSPGPDFDFGSGPQLMTVKTDAGKPQKIIGAGQKSGQYWGLDAATGNILWSQAAGPGSSLGGIEWGSATDGKRIYIAEADPFGTPYTTVGGQTINYGSWAALDPASGKVLWQTPDPSGNAALGFMTTANGVVYAPSMSGNMYALDAATGEVLWNFTAPGAAIGGASVVSGTVYWGSGYSHLGIPGWNASTSFYAFTLNGK